MTVKHATFTLERTYPVPPERVFAAWSDPAAKVHWFVPDGTHTLDFRVGGTETVDALGPDDTKLSVVSTYHDIVPERRIVYATTLSGGTALATVSITTVEFEADGDGTRLVLTEQGTFLDGAEQPEWREQGTGDWLDRLGEALK
ncbi:SRPBCC family protein [Amycolatopsis sp. SID8362]|uniref:SRPBCC family protein n=1 Tax=Amycolatopsis sp. SID8362 TaxID=2690346 RepID=UPI00136FA4FD|nr:SRPBCC family protein [Amycolatopsis sp. SID8362]NBH11037.1 polyketide cyclase [Amycolatopsis sp. SID8362]NED47728.1 polyketide cyclase [Amycolatopsis sp. SID8362]